MALYALKDSVMFALDYLGRFFRLERADGTVIPTRVALLQQNTAVVLTGTTVETVLATVTVPAKMLGTSGSLIVIAHWSHTNNANTKTKRLKFGAFDFANAHAETTTATSRDFFMMYNKTATTQGAYDGSGFGGVAAALLAGTVDTTQDVVLNITGQLANAADTLTLQSVTVEAVAS